ncbi:hypothetical protein LTR15_012862 [Elasticomyces elasticus]|nr:hypothetical protein LTR15_012862 [Elasticomyces elasticus]
MPDDYFSTRLQDLSSQLMSIVDARDYENPMLAQYMSSEFQISNGSDEDMSAVSLKEFLENMRQRGAQQPSYNFEVVSTVTDIDEGHGKASVWVTTKVTSYYGDGVRRDGVSRLDWMRKAGGKWVCFKHVGMTGSGALLEGF